MKQKISLVLAVIVLWAGYSEYQSYKLGAEMRDDPPVFHNSGTDYECDGRTHCSEMTSCEEATYFIQNCPNTKMDGDLDGIPCERQWCD